MIAPIIKDTIKGFKIPPTQNATESYEGSYIFKPKKFKKSVKGIPITMFRRNKDPAKGTKDKSSKLAEIPKPINPPFNQIFIMKLKSLCLYT